MGPYAAGRVEALAEAAPGVGHRWVRAGRRAIEQGLGTDLGRYTAESFSPRLGGSLPSAEPSSYFCQWNARGAGVSGPCFLEQHEIVSVLDHFLEGLVLFAGQDDELDAAVLLQKLGPE